VKADVSFGALDATVAVDEDKARKKKVAAVAYYERELGDAHDAVERLRGKAAKLRRQAADAEAALADATGAVQEARERYETAKAEVH
jgi:hypothetical protein